MKIFSMALAGATLLGAVAVGSVGASAQGVGIGVGPGGVYVGSDNGYRRGDGYRARRDYRDSRAYYRNRDRDTVIIKKRYRPDGSVVIRRDSY